MVKDISPIDYIIMGLKSKLIEDKQGRIHVVTEDGTISMGFIDKVLLYQDSNAAMKALGKIKFSSRQTIC